MVLVGGPAMVEAVRTSASTFAIWAIVAVAMLCLAGWLVGVYIADGYQTRLSRLRRRMDAPGPVLSGAERPAQAGSAAAAASIPGQRRDAGQPAPAREPEAGQPEPDETVASRGRHARPDASYYAAADYYEAADYKAAEPRPAGGYPPGERAAAERPAGEQPAAEHPAGERLASGVGAGGDPVGDAGTGSHGDAPTRPDLPAQPGVPAQAGQPGQQAEATPTGRHAMPSQRSGDADRAERTFAGPDADRQDDQDRE
jgi:hypothetical protein